MEMMLWYLVSIGIFVFIVCVPLWLGIAWLLTLIVDRLESAAPLNEEVPPDT